MKGQRKKQELACRGVGRADEGVLLVVVVAGVASERAAAGCAVRAAAV